MSIVEVRNISFAYEDNHDVLHDVSFNIEKGSYTAIVGHNGSGKSTIAKLMAGLLEFQKGTITIDGKLLNEENITDIRSKLGIVFQNPDNQFIGSTVRDDIAFGLENYSVDPSKMDAIIDKFSDVVGMREYLDREPSNLSGGQKQRVAIAGILAMNPEIIIFDEATSMLDPKGKSEIKNVIYELHNEKKLTIISITHDIEEAINSDHVIVMNQGYKYMDDTPDNIFKKTKELRKIGLDIPFTYQVKEALCDVGIKVDYVNDLKGLVDEICQ